MEVKYRIIVAILLGVTALNASPANSDSNGKLGHASSGQSLITVVIPEIVAIKNSVDYSRPFIAAADNKLNSFCLAANDFGNSYSVTTLRKNNNLKLPLVLWRNGAGDLEPLPIEKSMRVSALKGASGNFCKNGIAADFEVVGWEKLPVKDRSITFMFEPSV